MVDAWCQLDAALHSVEGSRLGGVKKDQLPVPVWALSLCGDRPDDLFCFSLCSI